MRRKVYSSDQLAQLVDTVVRHDPAVSVDAKQLGDRLEAGLNQMSSGSPDQPDITATGYGEQLDAALARTAIIFLEFSQMAKVDPLSLPFDSDERFFDFALVALAPYFSEAGLSRDLIAKQWNRLKADEGYIKPKLPTERA